MLYHLDHFQWQVFCYIFSENVSAIIHSASKVPWALLSALTQPLTFLRDRTGLIICLLGISYT